MERAQKGSRKSTPALVHIRNGGPIMTRARFFGEGNPATLESLCWRETYALWILPDMVLEPPYVVIAGGLQTFANLRSVQ